MALVPPGATVDDQDSPHLTGMTITITNATGVTVESDSASANECYSPPVVNVNATCTGENGVYQFGASLTGGNPLGTFTYTITTPNGDTVQSGTLDELIQGITLTTKFETLTVTVPQNGVDTTASATQDASCYTSPTLELATDCQAETNGVFGITANNTGGDLLESRDATQQRRLAAARRAHDGDELAGADLERHVVERRRLDLGRAVRFAEVGDGDHGSFVG